MELSQDVVESLAVDIASEFFSDQQLIVRYGFTLGQLSDIRSQSAFQKEVDEARRVMEDGGKHFVYKARRLANEAIDTLDEIRRDEDAAASLRARCANDIIEIAGVKRGPVQQQGGGQKIYINTNLAIGPTAIEGTYTVEAKAVSPEAPAMIERARAARLPAPAGSDLL